MAGAAALALARRRRGGGDGAPVAGGPASGTGAGSPSGGSRGTDHGQDAFTCACGAEYRVSGLGRHRVLWKGDDPVLGQECPECERPLLEQAEASTAA